MNKRTFDDFDAFADDYRNIHTQNIRLSGVDSYYFAEMKVKLLRPYESNSNLQILDVGCGDGTTEYFMHQYFPKWLLRGIDVSEESIKEAHQKNIEAAVFEVYDGAHIPAADNTVDIVFIAGVLHHVSFDLHLKIMEEVHRVLKPGGRLYLFEHNPLNPVTKYLVNTCVFDKEAKLLRSRYCATILKAARLSIKKMDFIIFFPRKGILSKFIFLEKYLRWLPLGGQYFVRATKEGASTN
jgi:SAM-dependent methyltransferase